MKISSFSQNSNRVCDKDPSFKASANTIYLPKIIGELGKFTGEFVGIPEKKLIQNTTALFLQPNFDLKFAEEEEKTDIAIKSASKVIAGGITGVTIRALCIGFFQKKINFDPTNTSIINRLLLPEKAEKMFAEKSKNLALHRLKMYNETLGTIAAIAIMTGITNKRIDVPLTGIFQDIIGGVIKENKTWSRSIYDTYNNRKEKVENWINKRKSIDFERKEKLKKIVGIITTKSESTKTENNKK